MISDDNFRRWLVFGSLIFSGVVLMLAAVGPAFPVYPKLFAFLLGLFVFGVGALYKELPEMQSPDCCEDDGIQYIPLDHDNLEQVSFANLPEFPRLRRPRKYRPATNRKLPFFGFRHRWGKYATLRSWKVQKRREMKAVLKAANELNMGAAETPLTQDTLPLLKTLKEMSDKLSVSNWGR